MIIEEHELSLLEWDDVLSLYTNFCASEGAKALYRTLQPCTVQQAEIQNRRISELKEAIIRDETPDFSPLFSVEKELSYAAKNGILSLEEVYRIGRTALTINNLIRYFEKQKEFFPFTAPFAASMERLDDLEELISNSITDDVRLNAAFYPQIGQLEKQITSVEKEIQSRLASLMRSAELKDHVQETIVTTRAEKYVVLIKSTAKGKVQGSIIDTSASGATYYFEPASVAPMNTKLLHLKNDLNRELFIIMKNLSEKAGSYAQELSENLGAAYRLDFYNACARLSFTYNYNPVELTDDFTLNLIGIRHPLLLTDSSIKVVANSISLNPENGGIIISGANTGGKTILLKTVAITVLLARYGLHAPAAPDSHVGSFERILIDIGDDQNIKQSLSTFSGQIVSVNRMIEEASPETLLIIDEIISGTNPRHAAALAMAILNHFSQKKARVVVSTHYPELKEYPHSDPYYLNASVSFNTESLQPTYRLLQGTPGTSYAFEIAQNYGMPETVLSQAAQFLTQNEIVSDQTIEQVNRLEHELEEQKNELERRNSSLEKQRQNYYELNEKLRKRIQQAKEEATLGILDTIDRLKNEITGKLRSSKGLTEKEAQDMLNALDAHEEKTRENARKLQEKRVSQDYLPFDSQKAQNGTPVFVVPLEKRGIIDSLDMRKKEAVVTLGILKSRFGFDKLLFIEEESTTQKTTASQPKPKNSKVPESAPVTLQTAENTIDLRGMRVDEALATLDRELDRFLRKGLSAATVIHGHGSGALKSAVREHLRNQDFILSYRAGEQSEGGDGVSIISM